MFSVVYVILPFSDTPPADAISRSLARFRRGSRGEVPDDWLRFEDETGELRALHEERLSMSRNAGVTLHGAKHGWYLSFDVMNEEMERRGLEEWQVRLCDIEPSFDRFVERFTTPKFDRHPVTRSYGYWRNGVGEWDYWELGGRFDGHITRQEQGEGRKRSVISSGESPIRDMIYGIADTLRDAFEQERPVEVDVMSDNNIELVATLLEGWREDTSHARPGALVLPPGALDDELRWLKVWPEIGPAKALTVLGLVDDATWNSIVRAVYERFDDHWAAGVTFHH